MKLTWKQRLQGELDLPAPAPPVQGPAPAPVPLLKFSSMTLDHWQLSRPHIDFARELFNQPMFRDLMAVLSNARPRAMASDANATTAAIALGRREGFDMLFGILLHLAEYPPAPIPEVPASYGAEEFDLNQAP